MPEDKAGQAFKMPDAALLSRNMADIASRSQRIVMEFLKRQGDSGMPGLDPLNIGSAFLATHEANIVDAYKQMIVDSTAADIVNSNLFTGVHGNYLRGSIAAAGMDPDGLPQSDPSSMDFGTDDSASGTFGSGAKPWKDIWGSGQGIGAVTRKQSTADLVATLREQYGEAVANPVRPR